MTDISDDNIDETRRLLEEAAARLSQSDTAHDRNLGREIKKLLESM